MNLKLKGHPHVHFSWNRPKLWSLFINLFLLKKFKLLQGSIQRDLASEKLSDCSLDLN